MIPNGERWHGLAVKKLAALLRGITSKHDGNFYCLNCLNNFLQQKANMNFIKKFVKIIKIFCNVIMLSENTKILEFNQYQKFDKAHLLFMLILNILKINGCKNNSENSLGKHITSVLSMSTISSFRSTENKHEKVL